jgi:hypothetical protein
MDLPIYELMIDDNLNSDVQVEAIALVDKPAIQRNFMMFKENIKFAIQSEERRIISTPIMIPDTPIYRNQDGREFYVFFSKDTVLKIAQKYFKKGFQASVNLDHNPKNFVEGVTLFESFISDKTRGINPMQGFEDLPEGTWFGSFLIDNDEVWESIKDGTFKGVSAEGIFNSKKELSKEEKMMEEIFNILSQVQ